MNTSVVDSKESVVNTVEDFGLEEEKGNGFIFNKIAIVGLGYVGLPLALQVDKKGFTILGIEVSEKKVEKINEKQSPFSDGRFNEDIKLSNLKATSDFSNIREMDVVVVCVPTPVHEDFEPNLEPLMSACESIAPYIKKEQLIVIESTINPGVTDEILIPILEKGSNLKVGVDFSIAHCPERINPGDEFWSVSNIPRVVGSSDKKGLRKAVSFYKTIIDAEIKPMSSLKEAEAVKIIENCFRDVNIAFVNELAMSFSHLGIDVVKVIEGASTKPFAFMPHFPGCGVGGHCIPVDPNYLIKYAKVHGFDHGLLRMARGINNGMPDFTVSLVEQELQKLDIDVKNSRIAVLGLSYKSDIDDMRESPSLQIVKGLKKTNAEVVTYDPFIFESDAKNLEEALTGTDVVVLATGHSEFRKISPELLKTFGVKLIIDGRNVLKKEDFVESEIVYKGIGR